MDFQIGMGSMDHSAEERLISLVREHECLYALPSSPVDREECWMKISDILQIDVDVIRIRWRSMRDHFTRQYRQEQNPKSTIKRVFNFVHYHSLSFLKDHIRKRRYLNAKQTNNSNTVTDETTTRKHDGNQSSNNKCGEVFHNYENDTFTFMCLICPITIDSSSNDFEKHVRSHFCAEDYYRITDDRDENDKHLVDNIKEDLKLISDGGGSGRRNDIKQTLQNNILEAQENIDNLEENESISVGSSYEQQDPVLNVDYVVQIQSTTIQCEYCEDVFACNGLINSHLEMIHEIVQPFSCNWCPASFEISDDYLQHSKLHEQAELNELSNNHRTCYHCYQIFENETKLIDHMKNTALPHKKRKSAYHQSKIRNNIAMKYRLRCFNQISQHEIQKCDKRLTKFFGLDISDLTISNNGSTIECPLCQNILSRHFLYRHICEMHLTRQDCDKYLPQVTKITCPMCNKLIYSKLLGQHLKAIHKIINNRMNIISESNSSLLSHINCKKIPRNTVPDLKCIKCYICNRLIMRKFYSKHKVIHHPNYYLKVKCLKCDSMISKKYLPVHMKYKHDPNYQRPIYECGICHKTMKQLYNIRVHMRSHTNEQPYRCPNCGSRFAQVSNLTEHLRLQHNNELPYLCQICGLRFISTQSLNVHSKKHDSKQRHNSCPKCGKIFTNIYCMREHLKKHTGEQIYQCNICSRTFLDQGSCRNHTLLHGTEKRYKCRFCDERFKQSAGRGCHERRIHKDTKQ